MIVRFFLKYVMAGRHHEILFMETQMLIFNDKAKH